jgi:hypothetical protein
MFGFKKGPRCGLCNGKLGEGTGVMQYLAEDDEGVEHMFSMSICKDCADDLDNQMTDSLSPQEVRDWLLKK